jgi:U3 small nucleolar RNA-associated protein 19
MDHMDRPILLADYLTQSYNRGGAIAVLALQSLFTLIAKHNIDYPHFFLSLYRLCSVEIFNAKYRVTFFKLLSQSLQSINLPSYLVAAFMKRLAFLSLHSNSCNSSFCVAQITWLLRKHPQCVKLLHHPSKASLAVQTFNNDEEKDLETAGALDSSLWEMEMVSKHFLNEVADAALALKDPRSTDPGRDGLPIRVQEHIEVGYGDLFEQQLTLSKNNKKRLAAQSHIPPKHLFPTESMVSSCFQ